MKQGKRLTYYAKKLLSANGLNVEDWMIKKEDRDSYTFIHKQTKEIKIIEK